MESKNILNRNEKVLNIKQFDIKVQIREDLKSSLIFGLGARPPIGIILGFVAFRHEVMPLM